MKIYPSIDLINGKIVRLEKGLFERSTEYSSNPLEVVKQFEADGAEYLHLVDLDGAKNGEERQLNLISSIIRTTKLKVQVGGGVRLRSEVQELIDLGVDKVVLGSLSVNNPELTTEILEEFGRERITLAIDVKEQHPNQFLACTQGWTKTSLKTLDEVIETYLAHGSITILCTDINLDGMLAGPNIELYQYMKKKFPIIAIQASGGVSDLSDLQKLLSENVQSVIIGKALYEKRFTLKEALNIC